MNAGLIVDATLKQSVNSFLATRKPGSGPGLPAVSNVPKLAAPIVDNARVYLLAGKRDKAAHLPELKQNLGNAGFAVINARYIEDVGQPGLYRDLAGAVRGMTSSAAMQARDVSRAPICLQSPHVNPNGGTSPWPSDIQPF